MFNDPIHNNFGWSLDFGFFFGKEAFEASIFGLKGFEAFSFRGGETAIFLTPVVDGLLERPYFLAVAARIARDFGFGQGFDDLVDCKTFSS